MRIRFATIVVNKKVAHMNWNPKFTVSFYDTNKPQAKWKKRDRWMCDWVQVHLDSPSKAFKMFVRYNLFGVDHNGHSTKNPVSR